MWNWKWNSNIETEFKFFFSEWAEDKVDSPSMLKLIYHGRFLHGSVTLGALGLPQGKTTVMHLVARENLPEPNSSGEFRERERGREIERQVRRDRETEKQCADSFSAFRISLETETWWLLQMCLVMNPRISFQCDPFIFLSPHPYFLIRENSQ